MRMARSWSNAMSDPIKFECRPEDTTLTLSFTTKGIDEGDFTVHKILVMRPGGHLCGPLQIFGTDGVVTLDLKAGEIYPPESVAK